MTTTSACHRTDRQQWSIHHSRILISTCMIVLLTFFLIRTENALADNVLTLKDEEHHSINLQDYIEAYDPGLQATDLTAITELDNRKWAKIKPQISDKTPSFRHTMWYRLIIKNESALPQKLVLKNSSPLSDETTAYTCSSNRENCKESTPAFRGQPGLSINIDPYKTETVFFVISGFGSALSNLTLQEIDEYKKNHYANSVHRALVDGIIVGLIFYMLLLAIKTQQAMYYSYCLLGLCNLLTILIHQRFPASMVTILGPESVTDLSLIMPAFISAAITQYIIVFTEAYKAQKTVTKFLTFYITAVLVIALSFLIGAPIRIILPIFGIFSIIATFALFYLCFSQKKFPTSVMAMLVIGISMPSLSGIITLILALTAVTATENCMQLMQTLDIAEMMFFSVAMLSSVKHLQESHDQQVEQTSQANIISEAHNRLLAHLNHELRTPLNGILGAAEILVHKSHPRDRHIFSMICHTALPLKHLIDQMVDISAVTKDQKNLQNVRFDLQNLLQECMDVFLPVAQEKNIRLFFTIEYDIANDVTGDQNKLRQILLNLIGNACKFTTNGEVGLSVRKEPAPHEGLFLYYFQVKDSGTGVTPEIEKRLFEAFETNNSTTNPKGTGLGLSIVRELSKTLGGNCGYRSNTPQGSIFWFSAALEPHQNIHRKAHGVFENLSVIVADENNSIAWNLIRHISGSTNITTAVNSAAKLAHEIDSGKYDIAIIHKSLANKSLINKMQDINMFFISYLDQFEFDKANKDLDSIYDETIIRKISIEAFSLQLADRIIKKSNLIKNKSIKIQKPSMKNILVAEDIPANQHIIREIIESLGFTATVCSNGKQAFNLYLQYILEKNPFDAIIMDCEMPIQDGFETTKKIRSYEKEHRIKRTPIIALTAHTESAYRQRSEQSGMNAYLTKPVTAERIMQCLIDQESI
ncbi:MAG TPA: response regulator [Pseudomonadales bacterium]|nr:response regulator [Pseudomonadales bacterium]